MTSKNNNIDDSNIAVIEINTTNAPVSIITATNPPGSDGVGNRIDGSALNSGSSGTQQQPPRQSSHMSSSSPQQLPQQQQQKPLSPRQQNRHVKMVAPLATSSPPVSPGAATPIPSATNGLRIPSILFERRKYEDEFAWERDPFAGSPESQYSRYELPVAHEEGDRALEIKMFSCRRPHMRAFHCAWISFFLAFNIWFAPAPLLKEIRETLGLSKAQLWNSSIANDVAAIVFRIIIGPIVDAHGARLPMAFVLMFASIPCALIGLVQNSTGLSVVRFFIGFAGCSFVMSQFWPSRMFSREIAGTANGTVAGWGNFGGAFIQLLIGRILFPIFKNHVFGGNAEPAWRVVCIFPAVAAFIWGSMVWRISDDAPVGNYSDMRKNGTMDRLYFTVGLRSGVRLNTLILYIQYACCFGVEIVMNNGTVLYFNDEFGLSTEDGSLIAFAYGSMNLLFRGLGGFLSDRLNLSSGLRGRLWLQAFLLLMEGVVIIIFSYTKSLQNSIIAMIFFSIFTQAAEGAIFGVVPYVSKLYTGSVSGIVGSGGNVGSACYGLVFRNAPTYRGAFFIMGILVTLSSLLTFFLRIPCHAGMIFGEDNIAVVNARRRHMARSNTENVQRGSMIHGTNQNTAATQISQQHGRNSKLPPNTDISNKRKNDDEGHERSPSIELESLSSINDHEIQRDKDSSHGHDVGDEWNDDYHETTQGKNGTNYGIETKAKDKIPSKNTISSNSRQKQHDPPPPLASIVIHSA